MALRLVRANAAEVGKPGPNWSQVPPQHVAKLRGILEHYRKSPHPFTECVRDNRKRFGPRTEQVCAVVKDLIEGGTHWRKGGRKMSEQDALTAAEIEQLVELSECPDCLGDAVRRFAYTEVLHPRGGHGRWVKLRRKLKRKRTVKVPDNAGVGRRRVRRVRGYGFATSPGFAEKLTARRG